jgi:small subunit ribosomal protein S8
MMTDPISDMLTRIRNGLGANLKEISLPSSKLKVRLAEIMTREGYLLGHEVVSDSRQGILKVRLKYTNNSAAVIGLKRASRPGRRVYVSAQDIPRVLNGIGIAILSTSSGLMTDTQAREAHVGGELLCTIW